MASGRSALAERQDQHVRLLESGFELLLSPVCAAVAMPHGGTAAREVQSFFSHTQIFHSRDGPPPSCG
jgi:hypothetical protein